MSFYKTLKLNGCAIALALLSIPFCAFFVAMLIGINRQYEEESCFDRNLTGKAMPRHELNELAEQCTKNPKYLRGLAN